MSTMKHTLTRSLLFTLMFTTIFVVLLGLYVYEKDLEYKGRIYPNVLINGESFDGKSKNDVQAYFKPQNEALKQIQVEVTYEDTIATFSGQVLNLHYDSEKIADHALAIGRSDDYIQSLPQKFQAFFNISSYELNYRPQYELDTIQTFLEELAIVYNEPPQNALFEFEDGKVQSFRLDEPGYELLIDDVEENIRSFLKNENLNATTYASFEVPAKKSKPDITIEDTNEFGIVEKIAEGKSDYTGSSAGRSYNVELAASRFHGTLIPPGEVFSYNKALGEVSRRTGYQTSYVIMNGRTVLGDGGGVCQDSTTLFRAALNAGLPIVERHAHAYRVKYYENDRKPGFDATVYAPSVDLKFKNDTDAYILIQAKVDKVNKLLVFEFYGKKDGRKVELSDAKVYGYKPAPEPVYEETTELAPGVVRQVDWAASGATSEFTYKVTHANGEVTQDRTFYSVFRPWRAVYQVGVQ